jgi:4-diphosphocytidyl-2-C-methyl-D-erythritol kinase
MIVTCKSDRVFVRCPAKLNLFLEVLGRRADGYHEIETVMQAVTLYDDVELSARTDGQLVLECSDPELPAAAGNLAWMAADAVRRAVGLPAGVSMSLQKRIPQGAGLGGGSSDAAGVLAGVDALFDLRLGRERLCELAAGLGSDIPYFLIGGTALCRGRGEDVSSVPAARPADYVICWPAKRLGTAAVYENLDRIALTSEKRSASLILESLARGDVASVQSCLFNRLGEAACSLAPEVARARDALTQAASAPALVTGSGSAVYVIVESAVRAEAVAGRMREQGVGQVLVVQTEAGATELEGERRQSGC